MDKIKQRIRNLSLRKSLVLHIIVFLGIASILSIGIAVSCQIAEEKIHAAYPKNEERYYLTNEAGERLGDGSVISNENISYSAQDKRTLQVISVINNLAVPLSFSLCMLSAVLVFYRNRLKKPIAVLDKASEQIANNNLNFTVEYKCQDEMGRLCASFERMRFSLEQNNQIMWRQMEQRKHLNAAFAHDLRTPLTVLKGYSEILQQENDRFTVKETALTMSKHIGRLERYVESMSTLQRIEDIVPDYQEVELTAFLNHTKQMVEIICEKSGKKCHFHSHTISKNTFLDMEIFSQVLENIVSNAVRYAKSNIDIKISEIGNMLSITVSDDGVGFSTDGLENAVKSYYTENSDKSNHFGLGLYISKMLCEHHGGSLKLRNADKGAEVTALFQKSDRQ